MIEQIKTFVNEKALTITEHIDIETHTSRFMGHGSIKVKGLGTEVDFSFKIDAKDVKEAYEKLEETATSAAEDARKQLRAQMIDKGNEVLTPSQIKHMDSDRNKGLNQLRLLP